jgi:hypothetical protein
MANCRGYFFVNFFTKFEGQVTTTPTGLKGFFFLYTVNDLQPNVYFLTKFSAASLRSLGSYTV